MVVMEKLAASVSHMSRGSSQHRCEKPRPNVLKPNDDAGGRSELGGDSASSTQCVVVLWWSVMLDINRLTADPPRVS